MIRLFFKQEHLFNPKSTTSKGFIENHIRNQRSHNPIYEDKKRPYSKRKADEIIIEGELIENATENENITFLKQKIVRTSKDRDVVAERMLKIHVNRCLWIREKAPSLTEILTKYPRYVDCVELVCKVTKIFDIS